MTLDIYDFDKTVVPFDSGSRFWAYCLLRYPWTVIFLPYQFVCAMLLVFGVFDLTRVKRSFFSFIRVIPL
ncbi:MAG: polysaccharide biosynthesis protein GtrA, partial [Clostridiales bacterium]|nr:polysaccharide biosynthesis protein GtrA [Clostridiales bacterium]